VQIHRSLYEHDVLILYSIGGGVGDDVHIFFASEGRTIFSSLSICVKRDDRLATGLFPSYDSVSQPGTLLMQ
jgi:hypothetical protein